RADRTDPRYAHLELRLYRCCRYGAGRLIEHRLCRNHQRQCGRHRVADRPDQCAGELGSQAVAVTFTTDDGRPATALQITGGLSTLPAGWSSTAAGFSCGGFSSGNTCQLPLTYAPAAPGSGTLALSYTYRNNSGESKQGSLNIAYRATANDNVVGTPSVNPLAVVTGTSTDVDITFTTDDGNPASSLLLTSDLSTLPLGWSS